MAEAADDVESLGSALEASRRVPFDAIDLASVPVAAAGVYAVWSVTGKLFYVGMAGRSKTADDIAAARARNKVLGLRQRLASHASGRRSGDQFCVYVADRLVLPRLTSTEIADISEGRLSFDHLVRDEVSHLLVSWLECPDGATALALELHLFAAWSPAWNMGAAGGVTQ